MREIFRAYYKPNEEELSEIWNEGIIVLDTNTLLNFFRYTPSTRDEFLSILENLRRSLWIPYHVGLEFQRQRLEVINSTSQAFSKITSSFEKAAKDITATLNGYKHHPSINRKELSNQVDELFNTLTENIKFQQEVHGKQIIGNGDTDQTFIRITELFDGKVGDGFSPLELEAIYEEGAERYEKQIPPGFKDSSKSTNQYGDLILWKEILQLGAAKKMPVIFVTDDTKEDWWQRQGGETQGPRVELIDEYWTHAERRIHFYEPLRFLEYAKVRTNITVSQESLEEVEEVSNAASRARRVLRDRQSHLEAQRNNLLVIHAQGSGRSLDPVEIEELETQYEVLASQLLSMETHLHMRKAEVDKLMLGFNVDDSQVDLKNFARDIAERRDEINSLEKHMKTQEVQKKRMQHKLRRARNTDPGLSHGEKKRLMSIEEEIKEVSLALEELDNG